MCADESEPNIALNAKLKLLNALKYLTSVIEFIVFIAPILTFYRYDSTAGEFSVPPAGDGLHYLYTNFFGNDHKYFHFVIRVNGGQLCWAEADQDTSAEGDNGIATCGVVANLSERMKTLQISSCRTSDWRLEE